MSDAPFDPARPRYTLALAGKDYELLGTVELVEAVEAALKDGIVQIAWRAIGLGVTDTAKLLSALLTASGYKAAPREIAQTLLNTVGVNTEAFRLLQLHAYTFLRILLEPPELREAEAKRLGEMMGERTAPAASPGGPTRNSA